MSEALQTAQITLGAVETILKAGFIRVEPSDGGYLVVEEDRTRAAVSLSLEKSMVTYQSLWSISEAFSTEEKRKAVDELNRQYILVRFSLPGPSTLRCDYQFLYEDGVTGHFFVNTLRHFLIVAGHAVRSLPEEMLA
ncbi:MAG: hypothetical protein ABIH26_02985 [Candidatus Eisenbacteria bacterium]